MYDLNKWLLLVVLVNLFRYLYLFKVFGRFKVVVMWILVGMVLLISCVKEEILIVVNIFLILLVLGFICWLENWLEIMVLFMFKVFFMMVR